MIRKGLNFLGDHIMVWGGGGSLFDLIDTRSWGALIETEALNRMNTIHVLGY